MEQPSHDATRPRAMDGLWLAADLLHGALGLVSLVAQQVALELLFFRCMPKVSQRIPSKSITKGALTLCPNLFLDSGAL